jgi:hypothetical protein
MLSAQRLPIHAVSVSEGGSFFTGPLQGKGIRVKTAVNFLAP